MTVLPVNWLRRLLGPDRATVERLAELESERSDTAALLDEVTELLNRSDQRTVSLKQRNNELKNLIKTAYEPVQVGECTKVRYTNEDDAMQHAMRIAQRSPGIAYQAYQCRRCPPYILTGERPWHAGSCRETDRESVRYMDQTLHYGCGCVFGTASQEWVWHCDDHKAA